jgi:Zn-dependent protease with chaperone function
MNTSHASTDDRTLDRPSPETPARSPKITDAALLSRLEVGMPRQALSPLYHLGLVAIAAMLLLLPLIYLGLIVLVGYGVYYHTVNHTGILGLTSERGVIFTFALYVAPIIAGPIAVAFMFKPFFAPRGTVNLPLSLQRDQQPFLFEFVEALCKAVGAPAPQRIDVNCDIHASAGFRRGFRSIFGNDLVLTIGLPLVSGLNLREFTGVLAHEFGHFAQGGAMRLTYIIRSLNS